MSVKIRLKRFGRKKKPFYRIVVANNTRSRDGMTIEDIGTYDPGKDPIHVNLIEERAKYWLSKGAIPTDTISRILGNLGIIGKIKKVSSNQNISKKKLKEKSAKKE